MNETAVLRALEDVLSASGAQLVITGGAEGVHRLWARAASHLGLPFHLYVPRGYQKRYGHGEWFTNMMWAAEEIHWTQPEDQIFTAKLNLVRNIQMIEAADLHVICSYVDPVVLAKESRGGTRHAAKEIIKRQLDYTWVNSITGEVMKVVNSEP